MSKIGIITFHRALNYGAVLQTYALQKTVKKICPDYQVEVIDYRSDRIERTRRFSYCFNNKFNIKDMLRCVLLLDKKRRFNSFLKKKVKISNEIYNKDNLPNVTKSYFATISGSDQIWNYKITDNDYSYLLDYPKKGTRKISYAASLGLNNIEEKEINAYKEKLGDFDYISVREKTSKEILSKIINNSINICLDPTLLLSKAEWMDLLKNKRSKIKEEYILVYNVPQPDEMYKYAKKLANEKNIRLVYIPTGIKPCNGKMVFPNVFEFLNLFKNAKYIITNSFHGTVFSIIFNKQMMIELKKDSTGNDRIKTLLEICDLSDRVYSKEFDIDSIINWKKVEDNLSIYINLSKKFLYESLK